MFSRGSRTSGRHARDDRSRRREGGRDPGVSRSRPGRSLADEPEVAGERGQPEVAGQVPAEQAPADRAPAEQAPAEHARAAPRSGTPAGPYDLSQAPAGVTRLDLGSLKVPSVPGVEVRVQATQQGVVQQVFLVHGESALQLGAYAAPRTESIWDEVREEIRKSLSADGVTSEEVPGDYGTELRARVRTQQGPRDLRFVGVSGPRWLLRAVYNGPAALDPVAARPLAECLRGVVVDRGNEAKPAKEPLPLQLSPEMASQIQGRVQGRASASAAVPPPAAGAPAAQATAAVPAKPAEAAGPAAEAAGSAGGAAGSAGGAAGPAAAEAAGSAAPAPVNGSTRAGGGKPAARRKPSPRPRRPG